MSGSGAPIRLDFLDPGGAATGLVDGTVASGVIDAMGNPTAVGVASTCPETDGEAGSIPTTVARVATTGGR